MTHPPSPLLETSPLQEMSVLSENTPLVYSTGDGDISGGRGVCSDNPAFNNRLHREKVNSWYYYHHCST